MQADGPGGPRTRGGCSRLQVGTGLQACEVPQRARPRGGRVARRSPSLGGARMRTKRSGNCVRKRGDGVESERQHHSGGCAGTAPGARDPASRAAQATQAQRWRCGPDPGGGLGLCTCGVEIWRAPRGASFLFWARCEQRGVWGDSRRPRPVSKWGPPAPAGCSASRGDAGQRGQGVTLPSRHHNVLEHGMRSRSGAARGGWGGCAQLGRVRASGCASGREGARGRAVRGTRCCEHARGLRRC